MKDVIEFYKVGGGLVASVHSSMVPAAGSVVSIRKITYKIEAVNFALDFADGPQEKALRCAVEVSEVKS